MRGRVMTALVLCSVDCTWSTEGVIIKAGTPAQHPRVDPVEEDSFAFFTSPSYFSSKWRDKVGSTRFSCYTVCVRVSSSATYFPRIYLTFYPNPVSFDLLFLLSSCPVL